MKTLFILTALLGSTTGYAMPAHKVTGTAIEFEYMGPFGGLAIGDMNQRAQNLCESMGAEEAERVSDITIHSHYHQFGYGRYIVTATALFICN